MSFRPQGPHIAIKALPRGGVDFVVDKTGPNKGNPRFDRTAAYPLFSRIFTHRGKDYHDATGLRGTRLYLVRDDRLGTPSRLQAEVEDGARQARAAGHIESATVKVDKPGQNYEISIEWRVPGRSDTETRTVRT